MMEHPFRIEHTDSFRVVGYSLQTTNRKGEGRKAIPAFWSEFQAKNLEKPLASLADQNPRGLFGINIYNTDGADSCRFEYMIAVASGSNVPDGLAAYTVPAMTWAVFPCTVETIGKTEAKAITKYLPRSNYRPLNKGYITGRMKSGAPDIEHYGEDGLVEVWVAVREKD